MRRNIKIALVLALFIFWGCDSPRCYYCDDYYDHHDCHDYYPPPVPTGVYSVTGDNCVRLYWDPVPAYDLDGYYVWRGAHETGYYYLIGETRSASFVDWDARNGQTYYYAVSSYDYSGNESDLSTEIVFDTPRPEGYGERVYIVEEYPNDAGYDFSCYCVRPFDDHRTDVFFGYNDITNNYYMQAADENVDILIFGPTEDLTDVDWAPENGWLSGAAVNLYEDYSYLVWTADNHFAHVRITCLCGGYIRFDWAYQTDPGNPELRMTQKPAFIEMPLDSIRIISHSVETTIRRKNNL